VKKRIIILLTLLASETILYAQIIEESPFSRSRNNIYLNTCGVDVSMLSINYERLFLVKRKFFLTGELGIGYNKVVEFAEAQWSDAPVINFYGHYLTIPHHITINVGKRKSFFEFGIGGTAIIGNDAPQYYYLYPIIGYRLHPFQSKKANFRVYASLPVECIENMGYIFNGDEGGENWGLWWFYIGVSFGIGF
jgi:hypothetical protein